MITGWYLQVFRIYVEATGHCEHAALARRHCFGIAVDDDYWAVRWQAHNYRRMKAEAILTGRFDWPARSDYLNLLRKDALRAKKMLRKGEVKP